jgi:peptidoglycan/xylan/chitin deacetylase (PgdA/CDA1 family)
MYHQVGEFERPASHRVLYSDVGRFRAQMRFLKWAGFQVIGLDHACRGLFEGAALPPRPVVLSFDDGYENFERHAWPVLHELGYPCSVFVVTGQLGGPARWLGDGAQSAPLMDPATVRRLHREGVDFGSHTQSHARLSTLPDAQLRAEVRDSKATLEDLLGAPVPHFCYPYGDYDRRARDASVEAGYRAALTCIRGAANLADNPHEIPRKGISYGDNLLGYAWKLLVKNERKGQGMLGEGAGA